MGKKELHHRNVVAAAALTLAMSCSRAPVTSCIVCSLWMVGSISPACRTPRDGTMRGSSARGRLSFTARSRRYEDVHVLWGTIQWMSCRTARVDASRVASSAEATRRSPAGRRGCSVSRHAGRIAGAGGRR